MTVNSLRWMFGDDETSFWYRALTAGQLMRTGAVEQAYQIALAHVDDGIGTHYRLRQALASRLKSDCLAGRLDAEDPEIAGMSLARVNWEIIATVVLADEGWLPDCKLAPGKLVVPIMTGVERATETVLG